MVPFQSELVLFSGTGPKPLLLLFIGPLIKFCCGRAKLNICTVLLTRPTIITVMKF